MRKIFLMLALFMLTMFAQAGTVSLTGVITDQVGGVFEVEAGQVRFTPFDGFDGTASAVYEIEDEGGLTATATVTVQVAPDTPPPPPPANTPPVATEFSVDAGWNDIVIHDMGQDISDAESTDDLLTITVVTPPAHGALTWSGHEFTYEVDDTSSYSGDDSFTYKVTDPDGAESTVETVTILNVWDT